MIPIDFVKNYLNLNANEHDGLLNDLISFVTNKFSFLERKRREILLRLRGNDNVSIGNMKNIKIIGIESVEITDDLINYKVVDTSNYYIFENKIVINTKASYAKVTLERGYSVSDLPMDYKLLLTQVVALEFKKSFKGEGAIFYSGRVVDNASFNYYNNIDEKINEIEKKIRFIVGGLDEISEVEV